jgi:predicted MFS family arabinose efflux permease
VPIFATYVEQLGASHKMAGIIVGSYGFMQMILRIPIGIASDRFRKRKLFINFGLFFAFFSGLGLFLTKDLGLILLLRSLAGAAAATWVDFTILFTSYYENEKATEAIGTISFCNSIGQMFAMLAGGWIAERNGWNAPFELGAAAGVAGLLLSFFLVDRYEKGTNKITIKDILHVVKDRTLITVSSLAILSQLLTFATIYGFTPVYADALGGTKFEMSLLTVFYSLATAFASLVSGKYLVRRFGERKVLVIGFILTGVFTIITPFTNSLNILIAAQIFTGIGKGFSFPMLMGLSIKDVAPDRRATAMGFFQSIYGLGMFLGPVLMGLLGDLFSLAQGFVILGVLGCVTAFLAHLTIRDNPRINEI